MIQWSFDLEIQWSNNPMIQWPSDIVIQWSCDSVILWASDPVIRWSCVSVIQWSCDPVSLWSSYPVIQWSCDPVLQWSRDPVTLWSSDAMVLNSSNKQCRSKQQHFSSSSCMLNCDLVVDLWTYSREIVKFSCEVIWVMVRIRKKHCDIDLKTCLTRMAQDGHISTKSTKVCIKT